MPFVSRSGMKSHVIKTHNIPTTKPKTKLFPEPSNRPTCRTCHHEVEPGLSLPDHCRLLHNLEVSTTRSFSSNALVKMENPDNALPSSRQVRICSSNDNPTLKVSVKPSSL
ncbi:hypothetical protein NPIL_597811, partial [Nephila pilipes]